MKKIGVLFLLLMIAVASMAQSREGDYDISIHARDILEVDADTMIASDTTVYLMDVAYIEWSADNSTYRKNYVTGDKWLRYSGYSKTSWDTIQILTYVDEVISEKDSVFPVEYIYYVKDNDTTLVTQFVQDDGLVSGGIVVHQGGLSYSVSTAAYFINSVFYISPFVLLEIDSADATFDRTDLFVVDTTGVAYIITGTPAANPLTPSYDPSYQIALTSIDVLANDNSGSGITDEVVYNENVEWTSNSVGYVADFESNIEVYVDFKSTNSTNITENDYIAWVDSTTTHVATEYTTLSMWLWLKEAMGVRDNITIQFYNNGSAVSTPFVVDFNRGRILIWQNIAISLFDVNFLSTDFDEIRVIYSPRKSTTLDGFYVDYVILQSGIDVPDISGNITLYGDVTGSGTSLILTDITPNIVSSVDGVINDQGNIDLTSDNTVTITPSDVSNTINFKVDTAVISTTNYTDSVANAAYDSIYNANSSEWLYSGDTIDLISDYAPADTITQTSHGYSVGDWITYNSTLTSIVLAIADEPANADVIGIVKEVLDPNTFVFQYGGIYDAGTWTEGANYFLSTTVAGDETTSQVYNIGEVYQFLGTGLAGNKLLIEIDVGYEITIDSLKSDLSGNTTDDLAEGVVNKYDIPIKAGTNVTFGASGDTIVINSSGGNADSVFVTLTTDTLFLGTDTLTGGLLTYSDTVFVLATKYDIDTITHFTTADETDPVYASDSAQIVFFADTVSTIATKYDIDTITHFVNSDEIDPVYSADSADILTYSDTTSIIATKYDIDTITHYTSTDFNTDFATKTTDDLTEGTNKYDQTVVITDSGIATVTGTYPNFNVDATIGDTVSTSLIVIDSLGIDYQENLDVDIGTEVVASVVGDAAIFEYVIKNGVNLRAGTIIAVTDGTSVEYYETSTNDLGNTSGVSLSVAYSAGIVLSATVGTDNWIVKTIVKSL